MPAPGQSSSTSRPCTLTLTAPAVVRSVSTGVGRASSASSLSQKVKVSCWVSRARSRSGKVTVWWRVRRSMCPHALRFCPAAPPTSPRSPAVSSPASVSRKLRRWCSAILAAVRSAAREAGSRSLRWSPSGEPIRPAVVAVAVAAAVNQSRWSLAPTHSPPRPPPPPPPTSRLSLPSTATRRKASSRQVSVTRPHVRSAGKDTDWSPCNSSPPWRNTRAVKLPPAESPEVSRRRKESSTVTDSRAR